MKINGRDVDGRKYSSNSSIKLNSISSRKARNNNSVFHAFDSAVNSKNISSIDNISSLNNLNRNITRDFSSSKGRQNTQFEQTLSKIILIIIFGPMILNLIVSIISTIFYKI